MLVPDGGKERAQAASSIAEKVLTLSALYQSQFQPQKYLTLKLLESSPS
jgi:hypothetical protein